MRIGRSYLLVVTLALIAFCPTAAADVWINEFHYDNTGGDTGEFVEVAGPAGTDLTGWKIYGYRDVGTSYQTRALGGTIPDQENGMGTVAISFAGMQNGPADGLALVDGAGALIELISYEGTLVGTDGPALGKTSVDVGVEEGESTPLGHSLQLAGTGYRAEHFTWQNPLSNTQDAVNTNQTFDPLVVTLVSFTAEGRVNHGLLRWQTATEIETAGFHLWRSHEESGDYERITSNLIPAEGGSSWGASYSWIDEGLLSGAPFDYLLEDIDYGGVSTLHGPVAIDWVETLFVDLVRIDAMEGGTVHFSFDTGLFNSGRSYGLLGSYSGTEPGTPLPGGLITLPLNVDVFTRRLIRERGLSWGTDFFGTLDSDGTGRAILEIPPAPGLGGMAFDFALVMNNPYDFASNPVAIQIVAE